MTQQDKCHKCGDQEFGVESDSVFRLAVPWLSSFLQREVEYACTACGEVRRWSSTLFNLGDGHASISLRPPSDVDVVKNKHTQLAHRTSGRDFITVYFPSVFRDGENVLVPTFEGNVQDATVVDRYGDPELMAEFAEEYLRQFWILMPTGRFPHTLKEIMPALLLLFTAAELALKAFWIRSDRQMTGHSLTHLYGELNPEHQENIESRFADSELHSALSALGADAPTVELILNAYSDTYGGGSNVHMDSRYYAEPTTMFREASGLRGANLVKGNTPYPIFLPYVVQSLIDAYKFYSGPERLRRLGADLSEGGGDRDGDNHGEWGLVPSSLGLVVVMVLQAHGMGLGGKEMDTFTDFKRLNPTSFIVDWMYGGNTLLFYLDDGQGFPDGKRVLNGLECRLWSKGRLGMHERDLHLLADALEGSNTEVGRFGKLPNIRLETEASS